MKRREALNRIVLGTGTVIILPASILSCSEDPGEIENPHDPGDKTLEINLDEGANSVLKEEGGHKVISGIIVAKIGGDEWVALSSICTHEGCAVSFEAANNIFPCDCHGSIFSSSGSVLQGPAETPLKQYEITKTDNVLSIKL